MTEATFKNYSSKINGCLSAHGISKITPFKSKPLEKKIVDFPLSLEIKQNTFEVLAKLGLKPETTQSVVKNILTFQENLLPEQHKIFPQRNVAQTLVCYDFLPHADFPQGTLAPLILFSHGGSIRPETTLKSAFLPLITATAEEKRTPVILAACDHRGSESDQAKTGYNLEDRKTDLEILLSYMLNSGFKSFESKGLKWNGDIVLIGNSMGGHVVAMTSETLMPKSIILAQPAAYSKQAHFAPLGEEFSAHIRIPDSWSASPAFDALERYLFNGGQALILGAENDEKVPGGVTNRYIKEVAYAYVRRAVAAGEINSCNVGYDLIPGGHTKMTDKEILDVVAVVATR